MDEDDGLTRTGLVIVRPVTAGIDIGAGLERSRGFDNDFPRFRSSRPEVSKSHAAPECVRAEVELKPF
jgi:hypothetical protein